jgi:hypothetical protein
MNMIAIASPMLKPPARYQTRRQCKAAPTLRVTPAMEAGISDHVWSLEEIVGLVP